MITKKQLDELQAEGYTIIRIAHLEDLSLSSRIIAELLAENCPELKKEEYDRLQYALNLIKQWLKDGDSIMLEPG